MVHPVTVHGVGPGCLYGYGLSYGSPDGVTVSTGEFHSLPVYGVVVPGNVICHVMPAGSTNDDSRPYGNKI